MPNVTVKNNAIVKGDRIVFNFQRTLRIPADYIDAAKGFTAQQDDESVDLSNSDKIQYFIDNPDQVSDGDW